MKHGVVYKLLGQQYPPTSQGPHTDRQDTTMKHCIVYTILERHYQTKRQGSHTELQPDTKQR